MSEHFPKNYPMDQFPDDYDVTQVSSTTDCTGLIPSAINSEAELEAYEDLYPFKAVASQESTQQ